MTSYDQAKARLQRMADGGDKVAALVLIRVAQAEIEARGRVDELAEGILNGPSSGSGLDLLVG